MTPGEVQAVVAAVEALRTDLARIHLDFTNRVGRLEEWREAVDQSAVQHLARLDAVEAKADNTQLDVSNLKVRVAMYAALGSVAGTTLVGVAAAIVTAYATR